MLALKGLLLAGIATLISANIEESVLHGAEKAAEAVEHHIVKPAEAAINETYFIFHPPAPCNAYPDKCHLPVDYSFFLGTHNAGAYKLRDLNEVHNDFMRTEEFTCGYENQDQNVTTMLKDGVRLLDIDLCAWKDGDLYLCHSTHGLPEILTDGYGVKFTDFIKEAIDFIDQHPYQVVILHLSDNLSNNPAWRVNLEQIEKALRSIGADKYIYTQEDATNPWPSIADLTHYGQDGEPKSRFIVTNSGDFEPPTDDYETTLVSEMFWQSTYFPNQKLKDIAPHIHQMCHAPGGIGYEAIEGFAFPHCVKQLTREVYHPQFLNGTLFDVHACHYHKSPTHSRLNVMMVDYYRQHWDYLKDLQAKILDINHGKWHKRTKKGHDIPHSPLKDEL